MSCEDKISYANKRYIWWTVSLTNIWISNQEGWRQRPESWEAAEFFLRFQESQKLDQAVKLTHKFNLRTKLFAKVQSIFRLCTRLSKNDRAHHRGNCCQAMKPLSLNIDEAVFHAPLSQPHASFRVPCKKHPDRLRYIWPSWKAEVKNLTVKWLASD